MAIGSPSNTLASWKFTPSVVAPGNTPTVVNVLAAGNWIIDLLWISAKVAGITSYPANAVSQAFLCYGNNINNVLAQCGADYRSATGYTNVNPPPSALVLNFTNGLLVPRGQTVDLFCQCYGLIPTGAVGAAECMVFGNSVI